jgi:hypothetical protein
MFPQFGFVATAVEAITSAIGINAFVFWVVDKKAFVHQLTVYLSCAHFDRSSTLRFNTFKPELKWYIQDLTGHSHTAAGIGSNLSDGGEFWGVSNHVSITQLVTSGLG